MNLTRHTLPGLSSLAGSTQRGPSTACRNTTAASSRRRHAGRAGGQRGWSIIEPLAAISIVAVMLATLAPKFSETMAAYSLYGAARQNFGTLQRLRMAAIMQNTRYRVHVSTNGTIALQSYSTTTSTWQAAASSLQWPVQPNSVTVSASGDIVFAPDGTAPSYGSITVTGTSGKSRQIAVSRAGRVRIQ